MKYVDASNKVSRLVQRLEKLNINIELMGNFPWVYIIKINNTPVTKVYYSEHNFTIILLEIRNNQKTNEFINIRKMFNLIRKYTGKKER